MAVSGKMPFQYTYMSVCAGFGVMTAAGIASLEPHTVSHNYSGGGFSIPICLYVLDLV